MTLQPGSNRHERRTLGIAEGFFCLIAVNVGFNHVTCGGWFYTM